MACAIMRQFYNHAQIFQLPLHTNSHFSFFCTKYAFLWEKESFILPKTGAFCKKTLLQDASKLFQTTSNEFFSTKIGLLWEKIFHRPLVGQRFCNLSTSRTQSIHNSQQKSTRQECFSSFFIIFKSNLLAAISSLHEIENSLRRIYDAAQ